LLLTGLQRGPFLEGVNGKIAPLIRDILVWKEYMDRHLDKNPPPAEQGQMKRIAWIYVIIFGLWVSLQSGVPFTFIRGVEPHENAWVETLVGWFVVVSSAWLLYLLMAKNQAMIKRSDEAIRLRDRAIESSVNGFLITSCHKPDNPIVYVNPAFESITGYSREDVLGLNPRFLHNEDIAQRGLEVIRAAVKAQREGKAVLRNYRKDGSLFWNELSVAPVRDETGKVTHFIGVQNDISDAKRYQEALEHQANHDILTGLPNRNLLQDRIVQAIVYAERWAHLVAVVFIDLDNFKLVNDSLGHTAGDKLLKAVAERLKSGFRAVDTVSRLGGDEFILILYDQSSEELISEETKRLDEAFSAPFHVDGHEIFVSYSAGFSLYPQDGKDAETLLMNADVAMYRAKEQKGNSFQFYAPEMHSRIRERLALESNMRYALERQEFFLMYQPQIDSRTKRVSGMEALIRWNHPEMGMISPAKFIPLTEDTGLIVPIGEWVIRTACEQLKAFQNAGLQNLTVAVNLSSRQFREDNLIPSIAGILQETGLAGECLELELTESILMNNSQEIIATLRELKKMGIRLAIDDFGTGYSSLSYLKRFPLDKLKIDQSFVKDISIGGGDAAIVKAIINMGHSLNLGVIAEGVETEEQLDFLTAHDCHDVQGYYYSKPLTAEEFKSFVERHNNPAP